MSMSIIAAEEIAEAVRAAGGRAYIVGGWVRDYFSSRTPSDVDIEVHGVDDLGSILKALGTVDDVGASYGVWKITIDGETIDVSLPRRDVHVGLGHKGFMVVCDPHMGVTEAVKRRDFTMNAMLYDPLTGELVDPLDGMADLRAGVLRDVCAETFGEDPLRVLRAMQMIARFDLVAADSLIEACRGVDLSDLSAERITEEVEKMLTADNPQLGIDFLDRVDAKIFDGVYPGDLCQATSYVSYRHPLVWAVLLVGGRPSWLRLGKGLLSQVDTLIRLGQFETIEDWELRLLADEVDLGLLLRFRACVRPEVYLDADLERARRLGVLYGPMPRLCTGADLIREGMKPGPEVGRRLREIRVEQARSIA